MNWVLELNAGRIGSVLNLPLVIAVPGGEDRSYNRGDCGPLNGHSLRAGAGTL